MTVCCKICVTCQCEKSCDTSEHDELIDVIGLHGNRHIGDDVVNNGSSALEETDPSMLLHCTKYTVGTDVG